MKKMGNIDFSGVLHYNTSEIMSSRELMPLRKSLGKESERRGEQSV